MSRVLVTGASGFVGSTLCETLASAGYRVRAAVRDDTRHTPAGAERAVVGDIGPETRWQEALAGVDFVIHLAARAHVMDGTVSPAEYLKTNGEGTQALAEQCAQAGVKRFIYQSSIKVNGEAAPERGFSPQDPPQPQDPYGVSKWAGEQSVARVAQRGMMQAAIVRSPLMYGPGVRANFLRLLRWVDRERILPLGAVHNRRSLVGIWNLCDLLATLLVSPGAPGRTFMVSDGEDVSTPELIRRLARAMGRRARLVAVPTVMLRAAGTVLGRRPEVARLCGSLTVDLSDTRAALGWSPPVSLDEGLRRTVEWYRSAGARGGL